jgi:tetratricopeptide (TPR) repeat protein
LETEYRLALTLIELKNFSVAKKMLKRTLKTRRSILNNKPDDAETLEIEDALAGVLYARGKLKKAEKLTKEVLEKLTSLRKEDDP